MATLFERGRDMIARVLPTVWVNELFTYKPRSTADTFPPGSWVTANGKRGKLDKRDQRVAMGQVAAGTIVFLLKKVDLTTAAQHDLITGADGLDYYVNFAELIVMDGEFWRCEVTKGN